MKREDMKRRTRGGSHRNMSFHEAATIGHMSTDPGDYEEEEKGEKEKDKEE